MEYFGYLWNCILILILGTGGAVTAKPVNYDAGEAFFQAPKPLEPVDDTMRVSLDLGPATEERKTAVLTGAIKLSDFGNARVEVCKSPSDCVPARYTGPYFTRDSYGIAFEANGPQLKHAVFIGIKLTADRSLEGIVITWSNYTQ